MSETVPPVESHAEAPPSPASAAVLRRLLAGAGRTPTLAGLVSDMPGDVSRALLGAWATACDILGFYRDRIADEAYLASAQEDASILWLARMAGLKRQPPQVASTLLSVTLADAAGQPREVSLAQRGALAVQNIPPAGEAPVIFESTDIIDLKLRWNAMTLGRPSVASAAVIRPGALSMAFPAGSVDLHKGDGLLITLADDPGADPPPKQARSVFVIVDAVEHDSLAGVTLASWSTPFPQLYSPEPQCKPYHQPYAVQTVETFRNRAGLFGRTARAWSELPADQQRKSGTVPGGLVQLNAKLGQRWQNASKGLPPGDVSCVHQLADGTILAGTGGGLYVREKHGEWKAARLPAGRHDIRAITDLPVIVHDQPSSCWLVRQLEKFSIVRWLLHLLHLDRGQKRDGLLYAGTAAGLLLSSDDRGASWAQVGPSAKAHGAPINDLLVIPGSGTGPDRIVAATNLGLQLFNFATAKWEVTTKLPRAGTFDPGLSGVAVNALALFKGSIVAASQHGLLVYPVSKAGKKTGAKGKPAPLFSWYKASLPGNPDVACTSLCMAHGGKTLFVGTGAGMVATPNLGRWRECNRGLSDPAPAITSLALHGTDLFAASATGIIRTHHDSIHWHSLSDEVLVLFSADGSMVKELVQRGTSGSDLIARFALAGIAVSQAASWERVDPPHGADFAWMLKNPLAKAEQTDHHKLDRYLLVQRGTVVRVAKIVALPGVNGLSACGQTLLAATQRGDPVDRQWPDFANAADELVLDRKVDGLKAGARFLMAAAGSKAQTPGLPDPAIVDPDAYRVESASTRLHRAFGKAANVTSVTLAEPSPAVTLMDLRTARLFFSTGMATPLATPPPEAPLQGSILDLGSPAAGLGMHRKLILSGPRRALFAVPDLLALLEGELDDAISATVRLLPGVKRNSVMPELDQGVIGTAARPLLAAAGLALSRSASCLAHVPGQQWLIRDGDRGWHLIAPLEDVWCQPLPLLELVMAGEGEKSCQVAGEDGAAFPLPPLHDCVWQSPASWQQSVAQSVKVAQDVTGDSLLAGGKVGLIAPVTVPFDRANCRVSANVVTGQQTQTIAVEVLGDGKGNGPGGRQGRALQLSTSPLAWSGPDASGAAWPDLEVYVDPPAGAITRQDAQLLKQGQRWYPTASIACAGPDDRVFEIENGPHGKSRLRFGDGRNGAALPGGTSNVAATYRTGGGAAGNVRANSLRVLRRRSSGVSKCTNPLPASGGRDSQPIASLCRRAASHRCINQRIVTLRDYVAFAEDFAGVVSARAQVLEKGTKVAISVLWDAELGDQERSDRTQALETAIAQCRADALDLAVSSAWPLLFSLEVQVTPTPQANGDLLPGLVAQALYDAFGPGAWTIGQPLDRQHVEMVARRVPGVASVGPCTIRIAGEDAALDRLEPRPSDITAGDHHYAAQMPVLAASCDARVSLT
ncbi:hypothetical protein GCM10009127_13600 [Alteraurantiacibacter aestuarii]|uniref:Baseplate protein J-like domain-containing protein n=1 Tax=Alteraurantiacibacter aestuarii TaxID=650004 RepID=A0A844ZLX3_9SPHN|nr:hypothetical protein [Alteraurantiacibacter aestuarii]MXO88050.1 hypothetical protein [Alteraurantiacibacter aestuarii]